MATKTGIAHVNPQDLRKFGKDLDAFAQHVMDYNQKLSNEIERLGVTCRDDKYKDFREHFKKNEALLKKFVEAARATTPKLIKDAEVIEDLQSTRIDR
jgi:hypothetical protein